MKKPQVQKTSDNVFYVKLDCLKYKFLLTSDVHFDHTACDRDKLKSHLSLCDYALDAGDFFCAMQGRSDKRGRKSDVRKELQRDDYFNAIIDDANSFAPLRKYLLMGMGNHEVSVLDKNELNLTRMACDKLGAIQAPYDYWVVFSYDERRMVMHVNHGSGGGSDVSAGVPVSHKMAAYSTADLHWTGHTHQQWCVTRCRSYINREGHLQVSNETHLCTPGYKDEYSLSGGMGYHIENNRPPKPLGAALMTIQRSNEGRLYPRIEMV